jgi:hypothetical protein
MGLQRSVRDQLHAIEAHRLGASSSFAESRLAERGSCRQAPKYYLSAYQAEEASDLSSITHSPERNSACVGRDQHLPPLDHPAKQAASMSGSGLYSYFSRDRQQINALFEAFKRGCA